MFVVPILSIIIRTNLKAVVVGMQVSAMGRQLFGVSTTLFEGGSYFGLLTNVWQGSGSKRVIMIIIIIIIILIINNKSSSAAASCHHTASSCYAIIS